MDDVQFHMTPNEEFTYLVRKSGKTRKEIAELLELSPATVTAYMAPPSAKKFRRCDPALPRGLYHLLEEEERASEEAVRRVKMDAARRMRERMRKAADTRGF